MHITVSFLLHMQRKLFFLLIDGDRTVVDVAVAVHLGPVSGRERPSTGRILFTEPHLCRRSHNFVLKWGIWNEVLDVLQNLQTIALRRVAGCRYKAVHVAILAEQVEDVEVAQLGRHVHRLGVLLGVLRKEVTNLVNSV